MTCQIRCHIRRSVRKSRSWESTNLSLSEDGHIDARGVVSGVSQCKNQPGHATNGIRLADHGDDGIVQSTASDFPHGSPNVLGVQDEPDGDHRGEEGIE